MKKLLLIPALMLGTSMMAQQKDYEITPVIGYNIAEGNLNLDNHMLYGVEAQMNTVGAISPELSVLYSNADFEGDNGSTNIYRVALNGVYQYEGSKSFIPLAKIGLGYETMSTHFKDATGNEDSPFADLGLGVKIPFTENIALKLEAVYMIKNNDNRWDNNLATLAGLNFAFGGSTQKEAPQEAPKEEIAPVVVDGDDDNDGVLNSVDKCPSTAEGKTVNAEGCFIDGDDDKDGVLNSVDKCPTTAAGKTVDAEGCFVDGDDDNDGVLNSIDECPNTPTAVTKVDEVGCGVAVNLHITFDNGAYTVDADSEKRVQKFADFLNAKTNYTAVIAGYTDNVGRESGNKKLSLKRANIVKDMLVEKGVSADRITTEGRGEADPVATNDTAEGRAENRRIEAELTKN